MSPGSCFARFSQAKMIDRVRCSKNEKKTPWKSHTEWKRINWWLKFFHCTHKNSTVTERDKILLTRLHFTHCPSQSPRLPGLEALRMSHQAFYHLSMNKPWVPSLAFTQEEGTHPLTAHMWSQCTQGNKQATGTQQKELISLLNLLFVFKFSFALHSSDTTRHNFCIFCTMFVVIFIWCNGSSRSSVSLSCEFYMSCA